MSRCRKRTLAALASIACAVGLAETVLAKPVRLTGSSPLYTRAAIDIELRLSDAPCERVRAVALFTDATLPFAFDPDGNNVDAVFRGPPLRGSGRDHTSRLTSGRWHRRDGEVCSRVR